MIKLVAFDLDKTLTESKAPLDSEMARLLCRLLDVSKIIVVSGASFFQFERQFLANFGCPKDRLANLFLLPASGTAFYAYRNGSPSPEASAWWGWQPIYRYELSEAEKKKIQDAFARAFLETRWEMPENAYGELIEDRGTQITFSALGQKAPVLQKDAWDPKREKRERLATSLRRLLPEFSVKIGGSTSIDITREGIDKAYGMRQAMNFLYYLPSETAYVGDALFPGGNDSAVIPLGLRLFRIGAGGPQETKQLIKKWLKYGVR